ncbi:potassium transporter Kup [Propionibacterium cyclohexanicum]|uniref:potassium transporter Kup n=1 Tax=Propionibacterium cyclohexanicum TaxID=64702 RepID=UPI003182D387
MGALGVVFGDIGTSPLYAMQTVFAVGHGVVTPTRENVLGVVSMVFWSITLIVSVKYVALVMRADNEGEGGILALTALLRHKLTVPRLIAVVTMLGMIGAGLFYGDSVITPAISVMSAFEGLTTVDPSARELVVPLSLVVLCLLFAFQRFGTGMMGRAFGPVMIVWFGVLGVLGLPQIIAHPEILVALWPGYALHFFWSQPGIAILAMGAVVLTITGAEALYADLGHFGPTPIRLSWFGIVFPCLALNYLGQAAMILHEPGTIGNPFFHLAPLWARFPLVVLAAAATVIASQAVISGAYSVTYQAIRLGMLPRLTARHTSRVEGGQIYLPTVNWTLFIGVLVLVAAFRSSSALADAYGLAVTGTLVLTTSLFLLLAVRVWHWPTWLVVCIGVVIGSLELLFFVANLTKLPTGGWLPSGIALVVIQLMVAWRRGTALLTARRTVIEGPMDSWVNSVRAKGVTRVPGVAIYVHANQATVPLALKENLRFNHVLHEHIAIVSLKHENTAHVPHAQRISVLDLGHSGYGIEHVQIRVGFADSSDVPRNLAYARDACHDFEIAPDKAMYFVSILTVNTDDHTVRGTYKRLYCWLVRNATGRVSFMRLPPSRTVVMGGSVSI